jgi:hypothetical protein
MKLGKIFFISILVVCICLTIWQKDNLKTILNEYWAFYKCYHYTEHGWAPKTLVIKEKVTKSDPEAAAIVNYRLSSTAIADNKTQEILSKNISEFPENQYFIYELALCADYHMENGLDPAILLKLSNRLIELDNKNSNYYYLKAFALLHDRNGNNFDEVAEAIKQAVRCEYYKNPYLLYRDRVLAIARKDGLPRDLIGMLDDVLPYNFFIYKMYEALLQYQNLLITEGNFNKADEISSLLTGMFKNDIHRWPINNSSRPSERLYGLGFGFGRWNLPQEIELQRKNLTKQEADQKRLEMCAMASPKRKVELVNKYYYESSETGLPYVIAVPGFIYFIKMAEVFVFLIIIIWILSFIRKDDSKIKLNKVGLTRFLIYGFVFFITTQLLAFLSLCEYQCCYSYRDIFFSPRLKFEDIKELLHAPLRFLILFITPLAIVLCMGIIRFFKPKFDNIVSRFISGVLIAIQFGLVIMFSLGHTYISFLILIIFVLYSFKYSFRKITLRSILKAFAGSSKNEIPVLRTDLLKLSAIAAVLCWLGFVLLAYPTKKSMEGKLIENKYYTYSFTDDYEKAYQNILNKINNVNSTRSMVLRCIPLVKSDDLPGILEKLKTRKFPSSWNMEGYFPGTKKYDELNDRSLSFLLRSAARDQMPVILRYMDNPDDDLTLVFRAQLGNKSVKDKLKNLLNEAMKEENDPNKVLKRENADKPRISQIISALSVISEPDEAYELFKGCYEKWSVSDNNLRFEYESVCTLPKDTILKIENLYLEDLENKINKHDNDVRNLLLSPLSGDSDGLYLDEKIATRILRLMLQTDVPHYQIKRLGIEHYLTSDESELLIKGLQSDDENLRAWCVWQLRKIDYKFRDNELKKITEDKSWKVRANLAIFHKSLIKENETSDFVKLVKSL